MLASTCVNLMALYSTLEGMNSLAKSTSTEASGKIVDRVSTFVTVRLVITCGSANEIALLVPPPSAKFISEMLSDSWLG